MTYRSVLESKLRKSFMTLHSLTHSQKREHHHCIIYF